MKYEWYPPRSLGDRPRTRAWLDELPPFTYQIGETLTIEPPPLGALVEPRSAAIELFRATNGGHYALLEAHFSPANDERLRIEIASVDGRQRHSWPPGDLTLAPWGASYPGLPREYIETIADVVQKCEELSLLGSGVLRFDRAAHNDVSSAPIAYAMATQGVMRLLTLASPANSADEVFVLIQSPRSG